MLVARRTESAEADLQEIAFQIGLLSRRPNVADKIIDELIDQANNLAINSQIGNDWHRCSRNRTRRAVILP